MYLFKLVGGRTFSSENTVLVDNIFLIFHKKDGGFDVSCKLSPLKTICMKCQILFSGKNKINV